MATIKLRELIPEVKAESGLIVYNRFGDIVEDKLYRYLITKVGKDYKDTIAKFVRVFPKNVWEQAYKYFRNPLTRASERSDLKEIEAEFIRFMNKKHLKRYANN